MTNMLGIRRCDFVREGGRFYFSKCQKYFVFLSRNVRFCEEETTIKGIRIPKDIHVEIPIYGMARDPENWENPEKFKPERSPLCL